MQYVYSLDPFTRIKFNVPQEEGVEHTFKQGAAWDGVSIRTLIFI